MVLNTVELTYKEYDVFMEYRHVFSVLAGGGISQPAGQDRVYFTDFIEVKHFLIAGFATSGELIQLTFDDEVDFSGYGPGYTEWSFKRDMERALGDHRQKRKRAPLTSWGPDENIEEYPRGSALVEEEPEDEEPGAAALGVFPRITRRRP